MKISKDDPEYENDLRRFVYIFDKVIKEVLKDQHKVMLRPNYEPKEGHETSSLRCWSNDWEGIHSENL